MTTATTAADLVARAMAILDDTSLDPDVAADLANRILAGEDVGAPAASTPGVSPAVRSWFVRMVGRPEHVSVDAFNEAIDKYLSANTGSCVEIERMLAAKPTSVAAFKRVMTEGSTWEVTFFFSPKSTPLPRKVKKVRSADIVFDSPKGDSYLTLSQTKVFLADDGTYFVHFVDGVGEPGHKPNVLKYAPVNN